MEVGGQHAVRGGEGAKAFGGSRPDAWTAAQVQGQQASHQPILQPGSKLKVSFQESQVYSGKILQEDPADIWEQREPAHQRAAAFFFAAEVGHHQRAEQELEVHVGERGDHQEHHFPEPAEREEGALRHTKGVHHYPHQSSEQQHQAGHQ